MSAIAILKLERSGFTPDQVEALAEYLDGQVATKADLTETRTDIKAEIAAVKIEVANVRADILKWLFAALIGQTAVLAALVKLL